MQGCKRVYQGVVFIVVIFTLRQAEAQFGGLFSERMKPFDYYVLSLSWSPEYCAGAAGGGNAQQCDSGRQFGFVVHGLWPQYERGYPQFCRNNARVNNELIERMLPIMPSGQLIRHEWKKHGTCSGLAVGQYFAKVEDAYAQVTIPALYKNPTKAVSVAPRQVKKDFTAANRNFSEENFAVICKGRFLSEIRVCLDKDLNPRRCSSEVRDACRAEEVTLRPVR